MYFLTLCTILGSKKAAPRWSSPGLVLETSLTDLQILSVQLLDLLLGLLCSQTTTAQLLVALLPLVAVMADLLPSLQQVASCHLLFIVAVWLFSRNCSWSCTVHPAYLRASSLLPACWQGCTSRDVQRSVSFGL